MATTYGALGQVAPAAASLSAGYTVPSGSHATAIVIACNRGAETPIRVAVSPAGAAIADSQYVVYDLVLAANGSISTKPMTLGEGDIVRVYSTLGTVSFTVTGFETTN